MTALWQSAVSRDDQENVECEGGGSTQVAVQASGLAQVLRSEQVYWPVSAGNKGRSLRFCGTTNSLGQMQKGRESGRASFRALALPETSAVLGTEDVLHVTVNPINN